MVDLRGISKSSKKTIYWKWDGKILPGTTKNFWEVVDPETIEKFTMLYDKFGVKIYEGDIVSVKIKYETCSRHISKVKSNYDGFYINAHPSHRLERRIRKLSDYCGRYSNDCIKLPNAPKVIVSSRNAKYYYNKDAELHREGDKPAIIYSKNYKLWYKNGLLHRDNNLPAIQYPDGQKEFWRNGKKVNEKK